MKPAYIVHEELSKYLNQNICFNSEDLEIVATSHLKQPEKIRKILRKSILTWNDIQKLITYPTGMMFVEIGGHVSEEGIFYNDYQSTCWNASTNKPFLDLPSYYKQDWHIHPWNIIGYGRPNFFSYEDVQDAIENKKKKILFVGHPFTYDWPQKFIIDARQVVSNKDLPTADLKKIITMLGECTPFIDPQVNWKQLANQLSQYNVFFDIY